MEECPNIKIKSDKNHVYFYSEVDRSSTYELMECLRESEKYCLKLYIKFFKICFIKNENVLYCFVSCLLGAVIAYISKSKAH